mgnify:CR=1 FL=1
MESIKSFLGNPYYLMTAVLAIAAFGFAATAVISLIQERKQKKEETQEEPLEKKLGVDTKKLKNVLNVPDLKRKKNIPVIEEEKTENAPEELPNDKEEVPVSNIDTEPEVLNPADVAEFKSRMRIEKALTYSQRSRYRDFETTLDILFEGMDAETLRDDLLRMEVLRYRRLPYRQENTTGNLV